MIKFNEIQDVHLEISSLCNARCPLCPRNFRGYPYNDGYIETNLSLESCKKIFTPKFLKQLNRIYINGNFGDAVMNPETPDIIEYFYLQNPNLKLEMSTNGSARGKDFWQRLAGKAEVQFCLDGLEDTHHLYRQNTSWSTIIDNAKTFIAVGGQAIWKMIEFDHNKHQIEACKQLSKELGFIWFSLVDQGRNIGPVYDKHGKLTHVIGNYNGIKEFEFLFHKKKTDLVLLEDITPSQRTKLDCYTKKAKSIYISSTGEVYPCCFLGISPKTYGHGEYLQAVNAQISPLVKNNNALDYSLEECINWFNDVKRSWSIDTYKNGRLVACYDNCGLG